ncbi:MAG: hypothetical protein KKA42_07155, partial [candidate division Zixibacteria bacterium]|nr:hypothetical protein [candidate division Zixibacteria bacterium]
MDAITEQDTTTIRLHDDADRDEADRWVEIFSIFIHDLESPFASMKYLLRLIESGKLDLAREPHKRLVSSSRVAVERAESILYDIMAVAKAGKVGIPVELMSLVPVALINEAIELASNSAQERGIEITFTNNAGNIPVQADPRLMKRTLD